MQVKNKVLFDASALLTVIQEEEGVGKLEEVIPIASISSVNLSEVISVLARSGMPRDIITTTIKSSVTEVIPFLQEEAEFAGHLINDTKKFGLSFGDRACIATGLIHKLEIYTTDQAWGRLKLNGLKITLARSCK